MATDLAPLVAAAGPDLDETARAALTTFATLVRTWNARMDLTAAKGDRELVDLLLADALVIAPHAAKNSSIVDVGTGCGAPGFALALLRPDLRVTLVEPLQKRISFLRTAIGTLKRTDVIVLHGKGEDAVADAPAFDLAISRATLPPPEWVALGKRLAPRVAILLAKAALPNDETLQIAVDERYAWPLGKAPRRLVIVEPR